MQTTYRLNVDELDQNFIEGLKATFKGKEVEIFISEVSKDNCQSDRLDKPLSRLQNPDQGKQGEAPVGTIVELPGDEISNEDWPKWQSWFAEADKLQTTEPSQLNLTKQERRSLMANDLAKKYKLKSEYPDDSL